MPRFYEGEYDTLVAQHDFVVNDRTALMFEIWRGAGEATVLAGPGYEVTHAFTADITRQRAEGILYWSPVEVFGSFARPRLFAVAGVRRSPRAPKSGARSASARPVEFVLRVGYVERGTRSR